MKKQVKFISLVITLICWGIGFYQWRKPVMVSFLGSLKEYTVAPYTDEEDVLKKGNSEILDFSTEGSIYIKTQINDKINYPYAGFRITPSTEEPFFDISDYDRIEIDIDSTNATFFILNITSFIEGFSHFNDLMTFRHHTKEIFTKEGKQCISLPMKDIRTQGWWYSLRKINPSDLDKPDFTKCHNLAFEINAVNATEPLYVSVSEIRFVKEKRAFLWLALIFSAISTLLFIFKKEWLQKAAVVRKVVNKEDLHCKPIDLPNQKDEELERLCIYLGSNYCEPSLTIGQVARETGVSVDRIPQILMGSYQMQYKQYLNAIRVKEAKRLLKQTDRQISEISVAVGYNYPSTFNRIFKELVGESPRGYRKRSDQEAHLN